MVASRGFIQALLLLQGGIHLVCSFTSHQSARSSHLLQLQTTRLSFRGFQSIPRGSLQSEIRQSSAEPAAGPSSAAHLADSNSQIIDPVHAATNAVEKPPFPIVLWRFTRPHTLIGSALAIPALHLLAAPSLSNIMKPTFWFSTLFCMAPSLLMNLYITGLNQITDVEIDRINKPNLPIPAGILSKRTATVVVTASLLLSLWIGSLPGSTQGLRVALWGSAILGTLYSLPPFRLKRFPLWAAFCIVAVRGTIINASFYAHAKNIRVLDCLAYDPACLLSSLFYCVFGVVIALMKDVPDVAGDVSSNVRTFSVRLGQKRIFHLGKRILMGLFGAFAIGFGRGAVQAPTTLLTVSRSLMALACLGAGASVRHAARTVDPMASDQVYEYYMHLWKWFYLSYLALPFAR